MEGATGKTQVNGQIKMMEQSKEELVRFYLVLLGILGIIVLLFWL
jgi:hypothetical protein